MKVKCIDNCDGENFLTIGKVYDVVPTDDDLSYTVFNDEGWNNSYPKEDFVIVDEVAEEQRTIDSHYGFFYKLTEDDIEKGSIKIDPYFVASQWNFAKNDPSGVIFHIFKTCARFGEKNSVEREIKAVYKSIKRLAELQGVNLD